MKKIRLAIIFGGNSSEYSVSLHSAESAIRHLNKDRYEVILIGISQDGTWYRYNGDVETLVEDKWLTHSSTKRVILSPSRKEGFLCFDDNGSIQKLKIDCILPILHGKNGEDGTLQGLLELAQIPFVGCNHISSAIAMDKEYTHIICEANGIQMAPYISIRYDEKLDYINIYKEINSKLTFPAFIKPANAGSSYGISKISNYEEFEKGMKLAFEHDNKVIVETGISGFEVGCAVLGNDELHVGEVDEINTTNSFFDFDAKYELENTKIYCPARISDKLKSDVQENAKKIFKILGCSGLARVDMFIAEDKNIYFNEINTIPGFTSASRYPTMMSKAGINFTELIDRLIDLALQK